MTTLRDAAESDYPFLAVLHNATHEPHFHVTSADLASRDSRAGAQLRGRLVASNDEQLIGMASYALQDFDRADRVWLDLAIHPDHLQGDLAGQLIEAVVGRSQRASAASLWMPVREDYLDAWPDPSDLGFHEVHRTFGGGFFLAEARDYSRHSASSTYAIDALDMRPADDVAQLQELYDIVHSHKILASPTITAAPEQLNLDGVIASASFIAMLGDQCIGTCLPARSPLGAWLSVITVHPDHRRRGIARALLASTLTELRRREIAFLNTAGVRSDDAYLGLLRSLGATIEPDWIAFERPI